MNQYNKTGEEILQAMPFLYGSYGYDLYMRSIYVTIMISVMIMVKNFTNFFIAIGVTLIFWILMALCRKQNQLSMSLLANILGRF